MCQKVGPAKETKGGGKEGKKDSKKNNEIPLCKNKTQGNMLTSV
jgi:hypothetical protein